MNAYEKLTEAVQLYAPADGTEAALLNEVAPAIEGLPWSFHQRAMLWHRIMSAPEPAEFDGDTDETYNARARYDLAALIARFVTSRRGTDCSFASGFDQVAFTTSFEEPEVDPFDGLADIVRSIGTTKPEPFPVFASALIELELPENIFTHLSERYIAFTLKREADPDEALTAMIDVVIIALEGRVEDFDGDTFAVKCRD